MSASLPTEPIGSIPRPQQLLSALKALLPNQEPTAELQTLIDAAVRETVACFEATGSPVISDGEQGKYPDFITYPIQGQPDYIPTGLSLPFANGEHCKLPQLSAGPFRYRHYADTYMNLLQACTQQPVKQAIISPAVLSLLYPPAPLPDYSRDNFIEDLLGEHVIDIRHCLEKGAHTVQIDFIEGPLAVQLDPSGQLLNSFVLLLNLALDNFSDEERKRIGIYIDTASRNHSKYNGKVSDSDLLPALLELPAGHFYLALANKPEQPRLLEIIRNHLEPGQRFFIGVTDPSNPNVESAEEVCALIMEAARYIPPEQLGTTDNCGFSPFPEKPYTDRDVAFAKIRARIDGTALASEKLGCG